MTVATVASAIYEPTATLETWQRARVPSKDHLPWELRLGRKELKALLNQRILRHVTQLVDAGLNKYQLAKMTGAHPSTYSKMITGKARGVGTEILYKLSVGLGIPPSLLMAETPLPNHLIPKRSDAVNHVERPRRKQKSPGPPIQHRAAGHGSTR